MAKKDPSFIGAIDQGTTSTRFIIYDHNAHAVGSHQVEFTQYYPEAGWVEHDAMEILESVRLCMAKAVDKATADSHNIDGALKAIGLTNQRETTLIWSKSTGSPLYNAIVWMDVRTSDICNNPGHPFAAGVTLGKLSVVTIDEYGMETFVTSGTLDRIQKSVELDQLTLYLDSDIKPWYVDKPWEDLLPSEWVQIFRFGTNKGKHSCEIQNC